MDREPAMAANCEAGFGSCYRDTSVNQAHNQQRGKTPRSQNHHRKAEYQRETAAAAAVAAAVVVVVAAVASLFAVHDLPLYPVPLTRRYNTAPVSSRDALYSANLLPFSEREALVPS